MTKAISTYVFVKQRLHPGMLDQLRHAGAETVEIFAARGHFDYSDRHHVDEIASWFRDSGMTLHSVHAPMFSDYEWGRDGTPPLDLTERNKSRRVEAMDEIKRAIEVAEHLPFRFLVQHIGNGGETFDMYKFENALSSIEHLHAFARPLGVKLLIENIPNEMATPEKICEYIKALHYEDLGVCFDIGHAHMSGSVSEAFNTLKKHIRSTHLHDNKGDRDTHLFIGEGSIDWVEAMRLLRSAPLVPPALIEIDGENQPNVVARLGESLQKLDEAAEKVAAQ